MNEQETLRAAKNVCSTLHWLRQQKAARVPLDIDDQIKAAEDWYHGLKDDYEGR